MISSLIISSFCDYIWCWTDNFYYPLLGGWCFYGLYCGMSHVALDVSPEHVKWDVGACDRLWSHLSSLRYAMFGGGCHHGMYCGWLYSNVINTPEYIDWVVGA